jgi:hypothetical protein
MKAHLTSALVLVVALAGRPVAAQPEGCSQETLRVDEVPLEVTLCVPARSEGRNRVESASVNVSVTERFAARGESFSRVVPLEFMAGAPSSRTMDDIPLGKLGIDRTLHVTIVYKPGHAHLEHAMLLPGAVPLK